MTTTFDLITRYCNVLKELFAREGIQFDRMTDLHSIELFEESIILSERIIRRYHLPTSGPNLDLLPWEEVYLMGEDEVHQLMSRLDKEYKSYLNEYLRSDVSYLDEALLYGYEANDVLADLGIGRHSYNEFVYNQVFLKNADSAQNVLNELRVCSKDSYILKNVALAGYSSGDARQMMLNRLEKFDLNYLQEYLDFADSLQFNSLKESMLPVYATKGRVLFVENHEDYLSQTNVACICVDFENQEISQPSTLVDEIKGQHWHPLNTPESDRYYYSLMNIFSKNDIFEKMLMAFNHIEEAAQQDYHIMPLKPAAHLKPAA